MVKQESGSSQISQSEANWRNRVRTSLRTVSQFPPTRFLHQEVQANDQDGTQRAIEFSRQGYGIIGIVPHRAFRDFMENMNFIFGQEELRDKRIDIPLAKHQYDNPFFNVMVRMFKAKININQHSVVTERTKEKAVEKAAREGIIGKITNAVGPLKTPQDLRDLSRNEKIRAAKGNLDSQEAPLMNRYFNAACDNLRTGGIIFVAPQATRATELRFSKRTLGTFLTTATEKKGVNPNKVALFFLGHEIQGEGEAGYKPSGGFNRGKTFIMRPGPCLTLNEALEASGGLRSLDRWAVEDVLSRFVSPHYLSAEIKEKLSNA